MLFYTEAQTYVHISLSILDHTYMVTTKLHTTEPKKNEKLRTTHKE